LLEEHKLADRFLEEIKLMMDKDSFAESFFATFKKQTVFGKPIGSRHEVRQHVFEFIGIYYNRVRRHSAN
jgi:hypothetical protein